MYMHKSLLKIFSLLLLCFLANVCCHVHAQSYTKALERQRQMFPQEKVYVMTDRDLYLAGDTARMRAWIYDCNTQQPKSKSKYVYAELRDAANNLKARVKLLNRDFKDLKDLKDPKVVGQSTVIRGYIALPPDLTSGDYTLVAYTYYMLGTTEEMFFRKRLHVMNPKDVTKGLLPVNLQQERPVVGENIDLGTAVPVGSNVAVSITDDRLCLADSTSNIVWSLSHQPDLFTEADIEKTQQLYSPTMPYEVGQIISGTVYGNISTKKPQPNVRVSMVVPSKQITDVCITDANGRFIFKGFDLPDSTLVFISAKKGKRTRMENITIDGDSLPEHISHLPALPHYFKRTEDVPAEMKIVSNTVDLANTQLLEELVVKGQKREKVTEIYQNFAAKTLIADELIDHGIHDLETAILHMPGVQYRDGVLCYHGKPLRFFIDNIEETFNYEPEDAFMPSVGSMVALSYPLEVIERIDLLRPADTAFLIGGAGGGGMAAICITLKDAADYRKHSRSASMKFVWPLGFQKYKKFNQPDADTAWPVIFWNSNLTIKDSADLTRCINSVMRKRREAGDRGSYTVHIDGFTKEGKPIHIDYRL